MRNLRAILFPHASLPEEMLKRALSFFGPLKICRPWHMDRPVSLAEAEVIQILSPSFKLEPSIDLEKLLAEYRTWIRINRKQSLDALLAFRHDRLKPGEAIWDIRENLRSKRDPGVNAYEDKVLNENKTLKWNLVLHMAQEIEDQEREADRLLRGLRKESSPLKDLLEEGGDLVHPLDDLGRFEEESSRRSVGQVLEAWISLFEGHMERDDLLLTFSEKVFQHLEENQEQRESEAGSHAMELRAPDFSRLSFRELTEAKRRFFETKEGIALGDSVSEFREGLPVELPEAALHSPDLPCRMMKIILRAFPRGPFSSDPVSRFSGKTVALISEEPRVSAN
jgi:hypothetical protein